MRAVRLRAFARRAGNLARRTQGEIFRDDVATLAGSVAFFGILALFPALIATISVYGLISDPNDVVAQIRALGAALPSSARSLLEAELLSIARSSRAGLTASLVFSLALSLFSASSGVDSLVQGVNAAYGIKETRSWLERRWLALRFTLAISLFVVVSVGTITALPRLLDGFSGLGDLSVTMIAVLRWPALAVAVMFGLAELYRLAPNRPPPRRRHLLAGTVLAAVVWLGASLLFSAYAESIGRFNRTYGLFGGFVVLLFWLYVSSLAILVGAEVNAELEADAHNGHGQRAR